MTKSPDVSRLRHRIARLLADVARESHHSSGGNMTAPEGASAPAVRAGIPSRIKRGDTTGAVDYSRCIGDDTPAGAASARAGPSLRLCVMATIAESIQLLYAGRLEYLANVGFEITVVCAPSPLDDAVRSRGVRLYTVPFSRRIAPWQDLLALVRLYRLFRRERFDIVEVSTPKAALIGALAAWAAGVRCRVHVLHGAPYEGKRGILGAVLRVTTAIPCRLSHLTLAVSPSVASRVCADGVAAPARVRVLGRGSANGVDIARFSPEQRATGALTRQRYHIAPGDVVIGFVGRLTQDKGINDLAAAFVSVHEQVPDTVLLLVGPYEERDQPSLDAIRILQSHRAVRHVGFQPDVVPFMAAMDVVVLPTYREGLGNVLLEAAAMGLPTVTTDATGARDAMVDGETGLSVPVGDVEALARAMLTLVRDPVGRGEMGRAGREWVIRHFDQQVVLRLQVGAYRALSGKGVEATGGTD